MLALRRSKNVVETVEPESSESARNYLVTAWILRVGISGCFIGHGAFGIITKAAWIPYFGVAGISSGFSWRLMPWIGAMDICIGLLLLFRPTRALLLWALVWTLWTALLRPLSGESSWEFWERAGNFIPPLAWLIAVGFRGSWFESLSSGWVALTAARRRQISLSLQIGTASLLTGHAGYALFLQKAVLIRQYAAIGLAQPHIITWVGLTDVAFALAVLLRPSFGLLVAICFWKIGCESLYPISGSPIWELVERFGSYAVPLSLAFLVTPVLRYQFFASHPESTA